MASTRIYRTCGTPTNDKIFTLSAWIRFNSATGHVFFGSDASNDTSWTQVRFSSDSLEVSAYSQAWVRTTRKFRDFSAWYHIVITCDSTQATAANRIKWWVNGEQITDFSVDNRSNTSLNQSWGWNKSGTVNNIGGENASGYGDFSIAHFHNIDGTAYQASDFGETDATTGIWVPKSSPSVSYGNNGYFLKFSSSGSLGTDSSGNNNTNTIGGNLIQLQDTPVNLFATLNPLDNSGGALPTLANGNLTITGSSGADQGYRSSLAVSKGKYYFEMKHDWPSNTIGIMKTDIRLIFSMMDGTPSAGVWGLQSISVGSTTNNYNNGTFTSYTAGSGNLFPNWGTSDVLNCALDLDNGKIFFGKNGTYYDNDGNTGNPVNGTNPTFDTGDGLVSDNSQYYSVYCENRGQGTNGNMLNFGNGYFGTTAVSTSNSDGNGYGLFEYAPPTGYYALCTKNINSQEYS